MSNELRELAEAATPGPWVAVRLAHVVTRRENGVVYTAWRPADEAFIAAASPDVVLGLLDRIDAIKATYFEMLKDAGADTVQQIIDDRDEAYAAVRRLAGALLDATTDIVDPNDAKDVLADPVVRRIVEGG